MTDADIAALANLTTDYLMFVTVVNDTPALPVTQFTSANIRYDIRTPAIPDRDGTVEIFPQHTYMLAKF